MSQMILEEHMKTYSLANQCSRLLHHEVGEIEEKATVKENPYRLSLLNAIWTVMYKKFGVTSLTEIHFYHKKEGFSLQHPSNGTQKRPYLID